jgi:5-methylcytosine-specific restriction endonuclease McrA
MICQICNGKNSTYDYRKQIKNYGFQWKGNLWEKDCSTQEIIRYRKFCRRKNLSFLECDPKYTRSANYRKNFFDANEPDRGDKYRCVYCGKLFRSSQITVDHLIPVNKVLRDKNKKKYRRYLKILGANSVNDTKNLVPACRKCNSKKSDHVDTWVIKGLLGKSFFLWTMRRAVKGFIFLFFVFIIFKFGFMTGLM